MCKILSIDVSLNHYGYSLWEDRKLKLYGSEKIKLDDSKDKMDLMYKKIYALVSYLKPDLILSEQMWFGANARVFGTLSQLNGMLFAIAKMFRIDVEFINIKKYRSFLGIKDKKHVFDFVKSFIDIKNDDESDAIALGMFGVQNFNNKCSINVNLIDDIDFKDYFENIVSVSCKG